MSVARLIRNILPAGILFLSCKVLAQPADSLITQERITFYLKQIDSLPYFLASGEMTSNNINSCVLPQHKVYSRMIEKKYYAFPDYAFRLEAKQRNAYARMHALNEATSFFYDRKDYSTTTRLFQRALEIAQENKFYYEELHSLRPGLNHNYFLSGDYEMAMKISSEGLANAESINDKKQMAHFNNVIGYIHMKLGNSIEAENYFSTDLRLSREILDTINEAHALLNLADLAMSQHLYDQAIDHLGASLHCYRSKKTPGMFTLLDREAYISNKMAEAYKDKGNYRKALPFSLAAVRTQVTDSGSLNDYDEANFFITAGDIYNHLLLPDSAIYYSEKGLVIASHIIHREFTRDAYEQLAIAWASKSNFDKAYMFQHLFSKLKDSLVAEANQKEIYRLEAVLQIERQKQLQKVALQRQRTWRNIIIAIAALLVLTVIFLYSRYRLKQKNRYQKELNRQQVELFNAIAATQDQERKRIAQDIHDSLGSVLSAAKLKLTEARELRPEFATDEKFLTGINLLDEATAELRNISHNIMPATLSKLGLLPALKNLSEKISSHKGLQVSFSSHEFDRRLDEQTEISIYRIILELINNIVKHASASLATVQLVKHPDNINITVEDNGQGFDYQKILQEKKGIGLGNIQSRVDYMKGTIDVDAVPGRGTTVIIDIPLENI